MDLTKEITQTINAMYDSEEIHQIIKKQVSSLISDKVGHIFRWGKFADMFEEKLQTELLASIGTLSFDEYNHAILQLLKKEVEQIYVDTAKEKMQAALKDLFKAPPAEYKLSELVGEIRDGVNWEDAKDSEYMTLIVEEMSWGHTWIYIDPEEDKEKYSCMYRMLVRTKEQTISIYEERDIRGRYISVMNKSFTRTSPLNGLERRMFHMIINGTKLIVDKDRCHLDHKWCP